LESSAYYFSYALFSSRPNEQNKNTLSSSAATQQRPTAVGTTSTKKTKHRSTAPTTQENSSAARKTQNATAAPSVVRIHCYTCSSVVLFEEER